MQGQALVCSSAAIQGSAEYAYKMHLDSRMGLGKEIESFFDTLVELNQYIAQGEYYIKMLYSYRGVSKTVPLKLDEDDQNDPVRLSAYRHSLFLLLRTEVLKVKDLMLFCENCIAAFERILDHLNSYQSRDLTYPEEILLAIIHFVDVVVKIDALKDVKTCLKNDFALYKRTFFLIKNRLEEVDEISNEVNKIQMFLSNPMHQKHYVLTMIRDALMQRKDGIHQSILCEIITMCTEKANALLDSEDLTIENSVLAFSCDQRYCPIRVLPHIYVLLDGLTSRDGSPINVFQDQKYNLNKVLDTIFKALPVIPLMFEMVIKVHPTIKLCVNYLASGSKLCSKMFKHNSKSSKQYYSLTSNDVVDRVIEQANAKRLAFESWIVDGRVKKREELFSDTFEAFQCMGNISTLVLTHIAWKYANPFADDLNSATKSDETAFGVNSSNREYARCVRYNYSPQEKDIIINLIGTGKMLASILKDNEARIRVEIRKHIHGLLQRFVQNLLPPMLRKAYKAKKMESVELMLKLRRIVCDWNGNSMEEPSDIYKLKRKDRKNHEHKFAWKERLATPSLTQIIVLRHILGALFHQSSESMKSDQGVVFKSSLFTKSDVSEMEKLYNVSKYFYDMLTYRDTIKRLSNFSQLWYREFYLEICKESQFPIALSMPWILVEHIIFTDNTENMKFIFHILDIYNDAGSEALCSMGQQYMYDEVEGEMNLVFDQLLYMLNRHLYTYYKNLSIFSQEELAFRKLNPFHRFYTRRDEIRLWSKHFSASKNLILRNSSYENIHITHSLELLGRKLNLKKVLNACLEREITRDLEKCFQDLEKGDICGIIRFEGLLNILRWTHNSIINTLTSGGDKSTDIVHANMFDYKYLVNAVNESVSIARGTVSGRISTFVIKELYETLLPNMVYISGKPTDYGDNSKNSCAFVYTTSRGNVLNKYTGQKSSTLYKTYEKIKMRRHSSAGNKHISEDAGSMKDVDKHVDEKSSLGHSDISSHLKFGRSAHSNILEMNYLRCEFFFGEIHARSLIALNNKMLGARKANLMYDTLYKTLSIQMEEKIVPYLKTLLPGIKPVILPSYAMKTEVNYLAVEATVKGFLRFKEVNHKVFKGIQEIGNALIFLKMLDWSFYNIEYEAMEDTVDKTSDFSGFDKKHGSKTSSAKKKKKKKQGSQLDEDEYNPSKFYHAFVSIPNGLNNGKRRRKSSAPTPVDTSYLPDIEYPFLKRGLCYIKKSCSKHLQLEKSELENLPMLFASLLFILCRPNIGDGGVPRDSSIDIQPVDLHEEYGEGLLFGCIAVLHILNLKTKFMQKSYNKHIINVNLSDQACMIREKERTENRRSSIGKVDKETENEIKAYLEVAKEVEELISMYSKFLDSKFGNFNASQIETEAPLGNLTPKNNNRRVNFPSAEKAPSEPRRPSASAEEMGILKEPIREAYTINNPEPSPTKVSSTITADDASHIEESGLLNNKVAANSLSTSDDGDNNEGAPMNVIGEESLGEAKNVPRAKADKSGDAENALDAVCMVYVLYDYVAQNDDELNLTEGKFVKVTELGTNEDMEWWNGYLSHDPSKFGTFPKNYVSLMLEFKGTKYLISTDTNEVYNMHDIEDCLGVFDDSTYTLTDLDGIEKDWSAATLL